MKLRNSALALLFTLLACSAWGDDWPQWRGPDRTGVSKEKGLLKAWPKDGPKLLWTYRETDQGFSGPAVVGNILYILGTRDDKEEAVIAIDIEKGKELWSHKIGPIFDFQGNTWGAGPRSTPTVDGNMLYVLGAQGNLVCLDITAKEAKGKELWRVNMIKDLKGEMMPRDDYNWGYSESPLVDGNLVLVTPGSTDGAVAALDKKTGKVQWRSKDLKNKAPYSSIVAADIHGVRQYIQQSYSDDGGFVSGIEAKSGKVLWSESIFKGDSFAIGPTPVVRGNLVYVTTGYGGGCHLFELDKEMKTKNLFTKANQKKVKSDHGGVVLIGDYVYGHTDKVGWLCQEFKAPGKLKWSDETIECKSGALIAAEGLLYLLSDQGDVALVEANPEEYKQISIFKLPEAAKKYAKQANFRAAKIWTHPVIANGRLYLRDQELLFCYDIRGK